MTAETIAADRPAVRARAGAAFRVAPLPICAHCGLPIAGVKHVPNEPLYCCGGCSLAHRLTGGDTGHGHAAGLLMSVGIGAFLAMNVMMLSFVLYSGRGETDRTIGEAWVRWALLTLATPAMVLLGLPFLNRGIQRARRLRLDADFLIFAGVAAAYVVSVRSVLIGHGPLFLDTAMGILLFVTIGRWLEATSRARTTDAIAGLLGSMPETARRIVDSVEECIAFEELRPGDLISVRPGERIPADGVIVEGGASISEAEITGESLPAYRSVGQRVAACTLSLDGALQIRVERTGADTTVGRLVRRVEEARAGKTWMAPLVDRVTTMFVPIVLLIATGTFAYWMLQGTLGDAILNTLSVLLIACPCAIGIATPLAATAAIGRAATAGVLVRSGFVFESLSRSRRAFFDKTGTLTKGSFELIRVLTAQGITSEELLQLAAAVEARSEHPIAAAIVRAARTSPPAAREFRAIPGHGVEARVRHNAKETLIRVGSARYCDAPGGHHNEGTAVHVSIDGQWAGMMTFRDEPRPHAIEAAMALQERGLRVAVLSGDTQSAVDAILADIPHATGTGNLTPEEKLALVHAAADRDEAPLMIGDGINDAPALSRAAAGVTLESGTELAREVSDVTILGGDLRRLPWVVGLASTTMRTARLNLFWAFFYNALGIVLAVMGLLHPLFGAVAMIVSSLLVVLHSQRLTHYPLPAGASR